MVNYFTFTQTGTKYFHFNSYDTGEAWEHYPDKMVDGYTSTTGYTNIDSRVQSCDGNNCTEPGDEVVTKVELRAYSLAGAFTSTVTAYLCPEFPGGDGDIRSWNPPNSQDDELISWSEWFDITNDTNAPGEWDWDDVIALQVDHYPNFGVSGDPLGLFTARIEIKATYINTCTMIVPEQVSTDHAQNVKEMNMWNGDRIVFGESRSKWSLLLKGQDWESNACDRILCLRQQGLEEIPVVVSGLNNINWDTEWMIKSIGWKLVLQKPLHYEWIILLEKT